MKETVKQKELEDNKLSGEYRYGFYTNIETDTIPKGLNEDIIRLIVSKKNEPEWMLEWRLKAFRLWKEMKEPTWPNFEYGPIQYQDLHYYSVPKQKKDNPKTLDEVDEELLKTFDRLGIPLTRAKTLDRRCRRRGI